MVCRTTISVTLHDFCNDVVYKLQEVKEELIQVLKYPIMLTPMDTEEEQ